MPVLVIVAAGVLLLPGLFGQPMAVAGQGPDGEATTQPADSPLDLKTIPFDGGTLHLDRALLDRRDALVAAIEDFVQWVRDAEKRREKALKLRPKVLKAVNDLLGIEPSDELAKMQRSVFRLYRSPRRLRLPDDGWDLYIGKPENLKAHMRHGGSLPSVNYNAKADTASVDVQIDGAQNRTAPIPPFTFPLGSDRSAKDLTEVLNTMLLGAGGSEPQILPFVIHEVAEVTLVREVRFSTVHRRWFCDGVAEVVTLKTLRRLGKDEAAEDHYRDPQAHAKWRDRANLRYWLAVEHEIEAPLEHEESLTDARYAFAAHEVKRWTDRHGEAVISKIVNQLAEKQPVSQDALLEAVQSVTGTDMRKRLARYNAYDSKSDAIEAYQTAYVEAGDKGNTKQELIAFLRLVEIRLADRFESGYYARSARLLAELGKTEAGAEVLKSAAETWGDKRPEARDAFRVQLVRYAFEQDQLSLAHEAATKLLQSKPKYVKAMVIHADRLANAGQEARAAEIASRIRQQLGKDAIPPRVWKHVERLAGQVER
jgi:hypothetical protein